MVSTLAEYAAAFFRSCLQLEFPVTAFELKPRAFVDVERAALCAAVSMVSASPPPWPDASHCCEVLARTSHSRQRPGKGTPTPTPPLRRVVPGPLPTVAEQRLAATVTPGVSAALGGNRGWRVEPAANRGRAMLRPYAGSSSRTERKQQGAASTTIGNVPSLKGDGNFIEAAGDSVLLPAYRLLGYRKLQVGQSAEQPLEHRG